MAKRSAPPSRYSVHPSIAMVQKWVAELREKTGRSLEEWIALVQKQGPKEHRAQRDWLKKHHGLGTNSAWWIADRVAGKGAEEDTPEGYLRIAPQWVDEMFAGPKSKLRPIGDRLTQLALALGKDVKICPCRTIVPFYREHVFAQLKPTTQTRLDFGLALGETKATGRLIDTGGLAKKDRITHRIPLGSLDDLDAEVERWLRIAYDRAAPPVKKK